MIKMKKKVVRFIACLLAMAVFMSGVPLSGVSAAETSSILSDLKETVAEVSGEQKEAAEEVALDAISPRSAGDWYTATKKDHLPWNYFHNAVQKDIADKNEGIQLEHPITYADGRKGRADIYLPKKKLRYIWEVRPLSYEIEPNKSKGLAQLSGYINSDKNYRRGNTDGTNIPDGEFDIGKYHVKYKNPKNGLILYEFKRNPDDPKKKPETAIQEESSKESAKDEVASSASGKDGEIAVGVLVAAAGMLYAKHKVIENTNSVSKATVMACVAFVTAVGASSATANAAEIDQACKDFKTFLDAYYGNDDIYREAIKSGDDDKINEIVKRIQEYEKEYSKAGEAQPPRDPLIIDLGASGIDLKSVEHGVYFDLDNNDFAEKTAWIGEEDGFLAFDRNGNGTIDNGGELFGDQVILKDGSKSISGFEALREMDDNEDDMIDGEDTAFDKLRVWIDANHNGKSEPDELKSLNELHIVSISLDYKELSLVDDETGTRIAETANVMVDYDGSLTTTQISEFWFPVNSSDTTQGGTVTSGNVPDILKAMEDDQSGELCELCLEFVTLNDAASKRYCVKKILYHITGAADLAINSRGGNMDARDLRVIEQFMGREFIGVGGSSPNVNAAAILKEIYADIENQYYNMLNIYAALGGYLKAVYEYEDDNGKKLDLRFLYRILDSKVSNRDDLSTLVYDFGVYLDSFDKANGTKYFEDFSNKYSAVSAHYADMIARSKSGVTYLGTDKNDSFNGTGKNEFIFGLEGDDTLNGSAGNDSMDGGPGNDVLSAGVGDDILSGKEGNDTLDGGAGNDVLKGGKGNDTYIFARGYGNDTVIDLHGQNVLWFKGLAPSDLRVNGTDDYDAALKIKGTEDTLVIRDFCKGEEYQDYTLKFEGAAMKVTDGNSPFRYICGDNGDDDLKAVIDDSYMYGFNGNDIIHGSKGEDVIYGGQGDDTIDAGDGDDYVFGGAGDDILNGGKGNDILYGGNGEDTYMFGRDYGTDIISDSKGKCTIQFEEDILLEELSMYQVGENAVIEIKDTEDKLIVENYCEKPERYVLRMGDKIISMKEHMTDSKDSYLSGSDHNDYMVNSNKCIVAGGMGGDRMIGTDDAEYVFGDSGDDQLLVSGGDDVIFGGAGKDYINGGDGDDVIDAGTGKDFIDGGKGNDVYLFHQGFGTDSIMDCDGENTILFDEGLKAGDIKAYRSNWNDLLLTFDGLEDTLNLKNYCISEEARNFNLVFADGTIVKATDANSPLRTIYGTDGSEYMTSIYTDGITKIGQDGDDQLVGSKGDDFLYGGKGNDRITGNGGDDVLDGGEGDDYLYGEAGNDRYIFKPGYGTDTIGDGKGTNTIEIYGYSPSQIKAYRTNWNNITITFGDSEDRLIIEGFFISEADRNFYLTFNGGSKVHATASNSPLRTIYGTDESEYIVAMDDRGVTIFGENGNDNLNGGNGTDKLYGGAGDDQLYGKDGNDVLDGGKGNDYLYGGAGKDTYIYNKGYGTDVIKDSEGINTISFGDKLNASQLTAYRTNWNDLSITFEGMDDTLIIRDYFTSERNRTFNVMFADGTKFSYDEADNPIRWVHATNYDDWMNAWSDDGIVLYGDNGNDHLTGGKGDDTLSGGTGNDYLAGGEGNDTYIFGERYGLDIIEDNDGENRVIFQDLTLDMVSFHVDKNGTFVISIKDSKDTLTIKDFDSDLFTFEFSNGVTGKINADTVEFEENEIE